MSKKNACIPLFWINVVVAVTAVSHMRNKLCKHENHRKLQSQICSPKRMKKKKLTCVELPNASFCMYYKLTPDTAHSFVVCIL